MSSSLFYDCYAPYPVYAKTEYINGDRKFGDLKKNDIIYWLRYTKNTNEKEFSFKVIPLFVKYPWHEAKGHFYITAVEKNNKKHYIDFGESNCWNVREESKNSSIVEYVKKFGDKFIGTNINSLVKYQRDIYENQIECLQRQIDNQKYDIDKLNKYKVID